MFTTKNFLNVHPFHFIRASLAALILLPLLVCSTDAAEESQSTNPPPMTDNPLLKESSLDFHYPPFDQIKDAHFAPAYEQGMAEQLKEIEPIAANPEPPTFENTIVALEKTGDLLGRVDRIFSNLSSANTNPALQKIETEMAPKLSAQQDAIYLERPALQTHRDALQQPRTNSASMRIAMARSSVTTKISCAPARSSPTPTRAKLKKMNAELAELQTKFSQNVLKEKNAESIVVDKTRGSGWFLRQPNSPPRPPPPRKKRRKASLSSRSRTRPSSRP